MSLSPSFDDDPLADLGRIHLIGVGGAGMSALTRMLCARGAPVTGSELRESRMIEALRALGASIHLGQDLGSLPDVDTVVVSTAIRDNNPELVAARDRGLRVMHRAEVLAYCMRSRVPVVIAGTHGKTTTTSMLAVALQHCGADPSFYIGAQLNETGTNAHSGSGEIFVAESDESDGSFLELSPQVAIVTNVEADHLDHWVTASAVHEAFQAFVDRVDPHGSVVACVDDEGSAAVAAYARSTGRAVRTYGASTEADVTVTSLSQATTGSSFVPVIDGTEQQRIELQIVGHHNVLNAAGALAAGLTLGFSGTALAEGLELYTGARRRFEFKGEADSVRVYDDYAHHHSEIRATLAAARQISDGGRLVVAFQPLRFTRTAMFHRELGQALGLADEVVVLEVYGSNEMPDRKSVV